MITRCLLLNETSLDPVHNLAVESTLLETAVNGTCVLYLWQNRKTVVIGRNQDAWRECRIADLTADQGMLVRRPTGGGAVFHDLGNLNFSFILPREDYDVSRQLSVILRALESFGLHAERSGRNDITLDGQKFSGNAFLDQKGFALHHGTLLVNVDMENLTRYLHPSGLKLQSKGIASVRSRVVNLHAVNKKITIASLRSAVIKALQDEYAVPVEQYPGINMGSAVYRAYVKKYRSIEWILGKNECFDRVVHDRFPWGEARLGIKLRDGQITDAVLFTDALDASLPAAVQKALIGTAFTYETLLRLRTAGKACPVADLAGLLMLHLNETDCKSGREEVTG